MSKYIIYRISWPGKRFVYFGKTKGYRKRRNRHLREMKDGTHHNMGVIAMYMIYGTPIIQPVFRAKNEADLAEKERLILLKYGCKKYCLNKQINLT